MERFIYTLYSRFVIATRDERGQDLVEYAVLCALVAVCAVAASSNFANILSGAFALMATTANNAINNA